MANKTGIEIEDVQAGTVAEKAGLLPGDRIVAINGQKVRDSIDLMFYAGEPCMEFSVVRDESRLSLQAEGEDDEELGITTRPFKIKTCRNNCLFCFVAQLPKGLRKPLYLKDEDFRMSFLYGSYITMTNLSEADKERIVEQRLSPLYISVHSTNTEVRNTLIGNQKAPDILKEIRFLAENRIRMHTQIVLCPGYNDGKTLEKTITDLFRFYPYVMSIAVVPLGLTSHRKKHLNPVEKEDALKALDIIHRLQARFKRKHGEQIVYGADELYIKAEAPFPPLKDYGELPQIENGVGLVPLFLQRARRLKIPAMTDKTGQQRFLTFTGTSFYPYLVKFISRLRKQGIDIEAVAVENSFFGKSVTVTGLLTGRDVIHTLSGHAGKGDILLVPDIVMREGDEVFLDDVSRQDIEELLGVKTVMVESTPEGLIEAISDRM
ncbi:MAG: DUF512 domain-containing protein [Thermodesulfovibrionales bacterium]|jgi:putative radical SAM enzyme (TIGR03279 family)